MPLCYVGGVKSIDDFKLLIQSGVEKVGLNSVIFENLEHYQVQVEFMEVKVL